MIAETTFWTVLILLVYTFAGYPLVLKLAAALFGKGTGAVDGYLPSVSMILSVYNEEAVIEQKIANFLALDYPEDKLEFIIVSDCCSDRTDELIGRHVGGRIRLLVQPDRNGKTKNLNRGVAAASGEILVFTDANSMFDPDAVKKLVRHFADPEVGLVSGKSVYLDAAGRVTSGGAYRRYEDVIKEGESRLGGIIGADGAIYALRKEYYTPLAPEYINDFIHTVQVALKGGRAVSDDEAICREACEDTGSGELRRQTRIMTQAWIIFLTQAAPLLKAEKFLYLWAFISHKFLRWLTIPLMGLLMISGVFLLRNGWMIYPLVFMGLLLFMLGAAVGSRMDKGVLRIPYFFMLLHYAALLGLFNYFSGNHFTTWNPRNN